MNGCFITYIIKYRNFITCQICWSCISGRGRGSWRTNAQTTTEATPAEAFPAPPVNNQTPPSMDFYQQNMTTTQPMDVSSHKVRLVPSTRCRKTQFLTRLINGHCYHYFLLFVHHPIKTLLDVMRYSSICWHETSMNQYCTWYTRALAYCISICIVTQRNKLWVNCHALTLVISDTFHFLLSNLKPQCQCQCRYHYQTVTSPCRKVGSSKEKPGSGSGRDLEVREHRESCPLFWVLEYVH